MIAPSDEDSFTFTVSAANGDIFKLRGKYRIEVNIQLSRSSALLFALSVTHLIHVHLVVPLWSKDINLSRLAKACIRPAGQVLFLV